MNSFKDIVKKLNYEIFENKAFFLNCLLFDLWKRPLSTTKIQKTISIFLYD
jgi:hypothetical protein